jgi:hypothetical protein
MHYVAVILITSEKVRDDLTECLGIKAFIDVFNGGMDILFL